MTTIEIMRTLGALAGIILIMCLCFHIEKILILILNKTDCFIKKTPPCGVVDSIIFEEENNGIPSHKFLTRLRRYKMVIKPF